jgi:hypothetical protein
MHAAIWNRTEILEFILSKGADKAMENNEGVSALDFAKNFRFTSAIEILDGTREKKEKTQLEQRERDMKPILEKFYVKIMMDIKNILDEKDQRIANLEKEIASLKEHK